MTGKLFERLEGSDLSPESLANLYLKGAPRDGERTCEQALRRSSEITGTRRKTRSPRRRPPPLQARRP